MRSDAVDDRLRPRFVRADDDDAGARTARPRLHDQRQIQRTGQQRQRPAGQSRRCPRPASADLRRRATSSSDACPSRRRSRDVAAGVRDAHPLQHRLESVPSSPPVPCSALNTTSGAISRMRVDEARRRSRATASFVTERCQRAHEAQRSALDRDLTFRTGPAHDDRDPNATGRTASLRYEFADQVDFELQIDAELRRRPRGERAPATCSRRVRSRGRR